MGSFGGLIVLANARGILYSMIIVIEHLLGMLIGSMDCFALGVKVAIIGRSRKMQTMLHGFEKKFEFITFEAIFFGYFIFASVLLLLWS